MLFESERMSELFNYWSFLTLLPFNFVLTGVFRHTEIDIALIVTDMDLINRTKQ